tara:strand:+ start:428 stop:589 length:162 start_codon:yes stop_codon:yes gene_type:complete
MIKEIKQRKEDIPVEPPSVKELEKRAKALLNGVGKIKKRTKRNKKTSKKSKKK